MPYLNIIASIRAVRGSLPLFIFFIEFIQGREDALSAQLSDVKICECGAHVAVPQGLFQGDDIQSHFQQMGGVSVSQGMGSDLFFDGRLFDSPVDDPLDARSGKLLKLPVVVFPVE